MQDSGPVLHEQGLGLLQGGAIGPRRASPCWLRTYVLHEGRDIAVDAGIGARAPARQAAVVAELLEQPGRLRQARPTRPMGGAQGLPVGTCLRRQHPPVARRYAPRHRIGRRIGHQLHLPEQRRRTPPAAWRSSGKLCCALRSELGWGGPARRSSALSGSWVFQCCQPASAHSSGIPIANTAIERVSTGKPATIWNTIRPA
jgi:hypothetical protein